MKDFQDLAAGDRDIVYLDNAATSFPKPPAVFDAMDQFARSGLGNPGRGGHRYAERSSDVVRRLRRSLAELLGSDHPERFAFTLNATDALNMAIKGFVSPGDHVVTGVLEHNSALRPLRRLEAEGLISLSIIADDGAGYYRVDDVERAINSKTSLAVFTHVSNSLGTLQPINSIGSLCRRKGVRLLVDAAQSAGVAPITLRDSPIDLLATSGHKSLFGPTGTGLLYVAPDVEIRPWREGGTGSHSEQAIHPNVAPEVWEAGTPNVVGLVGLAAGVDFIRSLPQGAAARHEARLLCSAVERLASIFKVRPLAVDDLDRHLGIVSFTVDGFDSHEVATILDNEFGVFVRAGLHCSPEVWSVHGRPAGSVRVSFSFFNTDDDVDRLIEAVERIAAAD
jgi:cysteine desulfurase family protein